MIYGLQTIWLYEIMQDLPYLWVWTDEVVLIHCKKSLFVSLNMILFVLWKSAHFWVWTDEFVHIVKKFSFVSLKVLICEFERMSTFYNSKKCSFVSVNWWNCLNCKKKLVCEFEL